MNELTQIKCVPCEGGIPPLTRKEFTAFLTQVPDWSVLEDKKIERNFTFKNFQEALRFVNACGQIAEAEGHHPDLLIYSWNKVKVTLYTHAIGGLSLNDFVVAAKIDKILDSQQD
jgi:4a-hydroxytetrahydrobiopterin dehydratase